jgi:hypothetical protein
MEIIREQSNLNTKLPLTLSVFEVDIQDNLPPGIPQTIESFFQVLKSFGFQFNEENYGGVISRPSHIMDDDNYSNFSFSKIEASDFREIDMNAYKELINGKIRTWSKTYNNMEESELAWFIDVTINQIDSFAVDYSMAYLFDLDPQLNHAKRHPHFDLYEFFVSLLFIENKISPTRISYVLISYG